MRRIFGTKKESAPKKSLDEVSGSLEQRVDSVQKTIDRLDVELGKQREIIRKYGNRPCPAVNQAKQKAMRILKQKRVYEGQREKLENSKFTVDSVAFTTTAMKDHTDMMQAMEQSNKEMQKLRKQHKELNPDYVYDVMDDLEEQRDMFDEVQMALGSYDVPVDVDESELMAEMDLLGEEVMEERQSEQVPAYMQDIELPNAPEGSVHVNVPEMQEGSDPMAQYM